MTPDTASVAPGSALRGQGQGPQPQRGDRVRSHRRQPDGRRSRRGRRRRPRLPRQRRAPNGAGFKLTTPLGPGQSVELPARVHVGPASGPGRVRLGASATGRYGDGPLAVPAAGDVAVEGVLVSGPAVNPSSPAAGPTTKNPVERKAQATAGASSATGSGGRKPARALPASPGRRARPPLPLRWRRQHPPSAPAPAPPAAEPPPPPVEPTPPAPAPPPAPPRPAEESAAAKRTSNDSDRRRYGWAGAAAVLAAAVAAAAATRFRRRRLPAARSGQDVPRKAGRNCRDRWPPPELAGSGR